MKRNSLFKPQWGILAFVFIIILFPNLMNKVEAGTYFSDSFENGFSGWTTMNGTTTASTTQKYSGSNSYVLNENTDSIKHDMGQITNKIVSVKFYDDALDTAMKGVANVWGTKAVLMGVDTNTSTTNYIYRFDGTYYTSTVPRTTGWHSFVFDYSNTNEVKIYIDDILVGSSTAIGNGFRYIQLGDWWGSDKTVFFDDVNVSDALPFFSDSFENGFNMWTTVNGTPTTSAITQPKYLGNKSYILNETTDAIKHDMGQITNKIVSVKFYDDALDTSMKGLANVWSTKTVLMGVDTDRSQTHYIYRFDQTYYISSVLRTTGWHTFKYDYRSGSDIKIYIDDVLIGTSTEETCFRFIQLGDWWGSSKNPVYFDDVVVYGSNMFFNEKDILALKNSIEQDGLITNMYNKMKELADNYMTNVVIEGYPVADWKAGRLLQSHVLILALTADLSDINLYREKAISILCESAENTTVLDFNSYHYALGVADAAHAYAVGYDWLKPYMTTEQKNLIKGEIQEFGQWLYDNSTGTGSVSVIAPWGLNQVGRNGWNWNGVTHGSLGLCALALGEHQDWLNRAVYRVEQYFQNSIDSTGCAYEGVSYLGYGLHNSIILATALERMEGSDIIKPYPVLQKIPNYLLQQTMPWGDEIATINQTDKVLVPGEGVYRIINKYSDQVGLWAWLNLLENSPNKPYGQDINTGVSLPYNILWTDTSLTPLSPEDASVPLSTFFTRGQVSMRDGWSAENSLVTFTSGEGLQGAHMHADANSFTFSSKNEKFFIDYPGSFSLPSTQYHNAILVDGLGQYPYDDGAVKQGEMTDWEDNSNYSYAKGDATLAYSTYQAPFDHAYRQIFFRKGDHPYILMVDDIKKDNNLHNYVSNMFTDSINTASTVNSVFLDGFENGFSAWTTVNGTPTTSASTEPKYLGNKSYKLDEQTDAIKHDMGQIKNKIVSVKFYDNATNTSMNAVANVWNTKTVFLGVYTGKSTTNYIYRFDGTYYTTTVPRTTGWHTFVFDYSNTNEVDLYIDDILVATSTAIGNGFRYIQLGDWWGSTKTVYFDDVMVWEDRPRALVTGGVQNNKCDVQFLWPKLGLSVTAENGTNRFIQAGLTGVNAKFVKLMTPFGSTQTTPVVTCTGSIDTQMQIEIQFSDGSSDSLTATLDGISLN